MTGIGAGTTGIDAGTTGIDAGTTGIGSGAGTIASGPAGFFTSISGDTGISGDAGGDGGDGGTEAACGAGLIRGTEAAPAWGEGGSSTADLGG